MTYNLFNAIADAFITLFDSSGVNAGLMITLIVISVIVILLLVAKAGKFGIMMVLAPLIITIAITPSIIGIPRWIAITVWLVLGFLFAGIFWAIMK